MAERSWVLLGLRTLQQFKLVRTTDTVCALNQKEMGIDTMDMQHAAHLLAQTGGPSCSGPAFPLLLRPRFPFAQPGRLHPCPHQHAHAFFSDCPPDHSDRLPFLRRPYNSHTAVGLSACRKSTFDSTSVMSARPPISELAYTRVQPEVAQR